MKEHEIFQTGKYFEIDGIVVDDLMEYNLYAEYIQGEKTTDIEQVELKIENGSGSSCMFLDKSEIDAMIGFLTLVRSKMGV